MEELNYVNYMGIAVVPKPSVEQKVARGPREAKHKGFLAVGIPPDQIALARRQPGHDEALYLRNAKPKRIFKKPFSVASAASEATRIAERSGWVACRVIEWKVE